MATEIEPDAPDAERARSSSPIGLSRREFVKKAAYVSPVILTLHVGPAYAKAGSNKPRPDAQERGSERLRDGSNQDFRAQHRSARRRSEGRNTRGQQHSDARPSSGVSSTGTVQGNSVRAGGNAGDSAGQENSITGSAGVGANGSGAQARIELPSEAVDSRGLARLYLRPAKPGG